MLREPLPVASRVTLALLPDNRPPAAPSFALTLRNRYV